LRLWPPASPSPSRGDIWRGSAQSRGYTAQWARYARDFRARFPFCGLRADGVFHGEHSLCARLGRKTFALAVDHITPIAAGGAMWDSAKHQALCAACHRRKTATEQGYITNDGRSE